MDERLKEIMLREIIAKRIRLAEEQIEILEQNKRSAIRLREIDRERADCLAAARVFGVDLPEQELDREKDDWRTRLGISKADVPKILGAFVKRFDSDLAKPPDAPVALPVVTMGDGPPPPMPRIKDIAEDRLKDAGDVGLKAADIQRYVQNTYSVKLHEKTVGMTLYRMSQENPPLVHRKGHTWFYGPPQAETGNPGAGAPGQSNIFE